MDELIRELEESADEAHKMADIYPPEAVRVIAGYHGMAQAYTNAAVLAREAKRRMADREPAWGLQ